ncbi:MAG: hypothetical protein GXO10_03015 [Crenarchaeota archaeon]|nr:hypothetical protein [Thermoproteota archaeon]
MIAYIYDIRQCAIQAIQYLGIQIPGWDNILQLPKLARNIAIGKFWRKNPELHKIFRQFVTDVVDEYIEQIGSHRIIMRQFDGFLSLDPIKDCKCSAIPIELRHLLDPILVIGNNQYAGIDKLTTTVIKKGLGNIPDQLVKAIVEAPNLHSLKVIECQLLTGSRLDWCCIEYGQRYVIRTRLGELVISDLDKLKMLTNVEIDRKFYRSMVKDLLRSKIVELTERRKGSGH